MRWCIIAGDDWGNTGFSYLRSLQSIGEEVRGIKAAPHPWYKEQLPILDDPHAFSTVAQDQVRLSDVVIYIHSMTFPDDPSLLLPTLTEKTVLVHHGGTAYRQNHDEVDAYWSSLASGLLIDTLDLLSLNPAPLPRLLLPTPVDTSALTPGLRPHSSHKLIGHYPSSALVKGSSDILSALDEWFQDTPHSNWSYEVRDWPVSHEAQIERLRSCSLYIDQLAPTQNDKPMGIHGIVTREAAALGIPVITNQHNDDLYRKLLGDHPLIIANTKDELVAALHNLTSPLSPLDEIGHRHRAWVERNHSYQEAGRRLLTFVNDLPRKQEKPA